MSTICCLVGKPASNKDDHDSNSPDAPLLSPKSILKFGFEKNGTTLPSSIASYAITLSIYDLCNCSDISSPSPTTILDGNSLLSFTITSFTLFKFKSTA